MHPQTNKVPENAIAVIGMDCRFPGANDTRQFWKNLVSGTESITFFTDDELRGAGIHPETIADPTYVRAAGIMEDAELFDAAFFGYTPTEAICIDPQQCQFLQTCWHALEDAGYNPYTYPGAVAVFGGTRLSTYYVNYMCADLADYGTARFMQGHIGTDRDHLCTRVSYKLNLRGPAFNLQCACSTSLVSVHLACQSLLNGECYEMNLRSVSNIIQDGGTILYTARCLEFKTKEGQDKGAAKCRELGIDALVVIGGDGSYRGARELAHRGIPMVGLPGTIDNDIACTDYTVGYDTAMNTAMEMIDKLRDTTQSHDRCSVVEVMGRNAGYIALNVAIASGAMAVLLPEHEFDMQKDILDKIEMTKKTGKNHFIIIVAEGVGHAQEIANEIQARTGIDSRATILGHVQRGGSPTLRDRVNASAMGYRAVCLIDEGKYNRIVGMRGETLVDYPVDEALEMTKSLDPVLLDVCNTISI